MTSEKGRILAHPGEVIVCPEGHPNYRVVEPIPAHTAPEPKWLVRIDNGAHPGLGPAPGCITCGCDVFPPLVEGDEYALIVQGRKEDSGW